MALLIVDIPKSVCFQVKMMLRNWDTLQSWSLLKGQIHAQEPNLPPPPPRTHVNSPNSLSYMWQDSKQVVLNDV